VIWKFELASLTGALSCLGSPCSAKFSYSKFCECSWQVRHNIAVAEYYRDGCTNPQKLLEVLAQVKVRLYVFGGILRGTSLLSDVLLMSSTISMTFKC
jgi:hypothetical protein